MADILVTSPYQPFTLPTQFKAVFNGYIYCGTVDAVDPSVSQVQVYLVNESGDKVPVAQPLRTNAGGYLVYNGQPAKFVTYSNHSLLVKDSFGAQVWYDPNMSNIDPESLKDELSSSSGAGMIGMESGGTVQEAIDNINQELTIINAIDKTFEEFGAVGDGVADDAPALQAALNWVGQGDYRKVMVGKPGSKYKVNAGLVIPWDSRFQDIGSTRYVDFEGSVLIAGAANITVLKMCHNFIHVNRPVVINPAAHANVTAYAIEPETNQSITQVSQMHCTMMHPSADGVYTGIRFGVGPTVAGQDSGAFWFTIFHPFCNNVALAWHFAPSTTNSCNVTRITMYNPVHTNGNTTWLLENANSLYVYGGSSENITIGTTPSATPTVFLGRDPVPAGWNMAIFADCHFTNYYVEVATRLYSIPGSNGAIDNSFTNLSAVGVSQRPTGNGEPTFNHRTWSSSVVTSTELGGGLKLGIQAGDGSNHQAFMYMVNDATTTEVELFSDRGWKFGGVVKGMTASDSVKAAFDGAVNLGQPSNRWATVYAAVGAINTSDVRYKVPTADTIQAEIIADVERREYEAASEIKKSIYSYKFTDAVAKKGEANARIHFGVGAQIVEEIMRRHNLAPEEYAFWCYDEWAYTPAKVSESGNVYEPEIPAGDRYGIRYDELIMFLLKYS